jgi:hypothetical protein
MSCHQYDTRTSQFDDKAAESLNLSRHTGGVIKISLKFATFPVIVHLPLPPALQENP